MAFAARDVVHDPDGRPLLVQALPKGGLKNLAVPSRGPVPWMTALPGELGLLGLLINKLVYRGRWTVVVCPLVGNGPAAPVWQQEARNMRTANEVAEGVMQKVRAGSPL